MCIHRSSCYGDYMDPVVQKRTATSSAQECRWAEEIQTREDRLLEILQLNFERVPWWTCSAVPTALSITAAKWMKYGSSNIFGGPCRKLTFMTWQVGCPSLPRLSCSIYQAPCGGGGGGWFSFLPILGVYTPSISSWYGLLLISP